MTFGLATVRGRPPAGAAVGVGGFLGGPTNRLQVVEPWLLAAIVLELFSSTS